MLVGDTIRNARVSYGYSLRAIAGDLEIAPSYLSDIERNLRIPTERVLRGISEALNLDFDLLMRQAGRISESVEKYLLSEELAGRLVRTMAESQLEQDDLKSILRTVEDTAAQREAKRREERRRAGRELRDE